jgi:hypothetical protein
MNTHKKNVFTVRNNFAEFIFLDINDDVQDCGPTLDALTTKAKLLAADILSDVTEDECIFGIYRLVKIVRAKSINETKIEVQDIK